VLTKTIFSEDLLFPVNRVPEGFNPKKDLPEGFYEFFSGLHEEFKERWIELKHRRKEVLALAHKGILPDYLPPSEATTREWRIELPDYALDQRNQMTGPADDAELVVKMLNSGAPGVMIDLEDSMVNAWDNLERGINNAISALHGQLSYYDFKRDVKVPIYSNKSVAIVRVRGLHLSQAGIIENELTSASLYDLSRIAFGVDRKALRHNLTFYIPKSESAEEALFWRDAFQRIEEKLGWEKGYIKCFALVESHPLAYQMEEFIFNLRDHILGLNLGRWDYMASLIHFNFENPEWVLPDRNTIPFDVPFFQKLRELMVEICHKHGILAIGGMTALFPNRQNKELNEKALKVLEADKRNEAEIGMDGAWTGHPDQNEIAVAQFPVPNQINVRKQIERNPELRIVPKGIGKRTLSGTRAAIRTVIRYRNGVLNGKGASLIDGYMEDLATDRIYRLMIAQRMKHRNKVEIFDESGQAVFHDEKLIGRLFNEELEKLLTESPREFHETLKEACAISQKMIFSGQFDPE
jgi:malate synthase